MREIKFRVWIDDYDNKHYEYFNLDSDLSIYNGGLGDIAEQYIDIKDIHGEELYKGDIVKVDYEYFKAGKAVVEWDTVNPCFVLIATDNKNIIEYDFVKGGMMNLEIIGNIHEGIR